MTVTTPDDALLGIYAQPDFVLARGEGCYVWDEGGRKYLDFTAGIAVTALGHGAPVVRKAITDSLATGLIHTSNLFRTRPGRELAELLVEATFPGQVFFCNSGAEANEAAIKFARRWARSAPARSAHASSAHASSAPASSAHGGDKHEIVAFRGAFHGRLFGTLAMTDREAYQAPFRPLMPGVHFADKGDVSGVEALLETGRVAAVIIEPIQGEGGVVPTPPDFLAALRRLCDEHDALLIFDEIQCGLGRTGTLFAYEQAGAVPDILTLAKPLAGGLPMGAVVMTRRVADTLKPGDHGTTFGGGPLVASVALAVLRTISAPGFLAHVRAMGEHLSARLVALAGRHPKVKGVRGRGLMQGILLDGPAGPVVARARDLGLLLVSAGPDVIRIVPPLIIREEEIDEGLAILEQALA